MKKLLLAPLIIFMVSMSYAQNVAIPDTAFLHALIDEGVDLNGDGSISYEEAEAVNKLDISSEAPPCRCMRAYSEGNIIDLQGIEAFINIDTLDCSGNMIMCLDLSANSNLKYLDFSANGSHILDENENLIGPGELLLDQCTNLSYLDCSWTQFDTLFLPENKQLDTIIIEDLTLEYFSRPSYQDTLVLVVWSSYFEDSVYVDNVPFDDDPDFPDSSRIRPTKFLTNYSILIVDPPTLKEFEVYPNPAGETLYLETGDVYNSRLEIYTINGKMVSGKQIHSNFEAYDVSALPNGFYLINVYYEKGLYTSKLLISR